MHKCAHFGIRELVHPSIYAKYGVRAWRFLQVPALVVLDALRDKFGPVVVNDWSWGGGLKNCGLRVPWSNQYAAMSIHKFGGAFDPHFRDYTPQEVHAAILEDQGYWYDLGIRRLESIEHTPTWLHYDVANYGVEGVIHVFNP